MDFVTGPGKPERHPVKALDALHSVWNDPATMSTIRNQLSLTRAALRTNVVLLILLLLTAFTVPGWSQSADSSPAVDSARRPKNDRELHYWLENMIVFHHFSMAEVSAATGLSAEEVDAAVEKFHLAGRQPPARKPGDALRVLPYPGGRHPRIGFLEGAINPQRETKVSIFTPWDDSSYVVADVPEAVFSNLGLLYLAHTHVPTIWDSQQIPLPKLEWQRKRGGVLEMERMLPNSISFGTEVIPCRDGVRFEMWLKNGTREKPTGMRVQNCIMLKAAPEFNALTNANKILAKPYCAVRSEDGRHWMITAFEPCDRPWANPKVPCIHSDPKFRDCAPGETTRIRGWLSFYEGTDIQAEFKRLDGLGWQEGKGK
jgi:hypothetical protein